MFQVCRRVILGVVFWIAVLPSLATSSLAGTPSALPGFKVLSTHMPYSYKTSEVALWYPADDGGIQTSLFRSKVFKDLQVQQDARVRQGHWPLVLLSHGSGGHWRSVSWLAVGLAKRGAIVVAVNHPGSTLGDYDLRRGLVHGSRARDLTDALDKVLGDSTIGPYVDAQRIYATGFSLGGWTALSIAGLRGDLDAYVRYCALSGHRHCRDIKDAGISLEDLDASAWNGNYRDLRVKAVAAIDPALHQGLTALHASEMVDAALLIALGQGGDRLPDTDFSSEYSDLMTILPNARSVTLAPAFHFTALPECKPEGAEILAKFVEEPVCSDPFGTDRGAVHEKIVELIATHFGF